MVVMSRVAVSFMIEVHVVAMRYRLVPAAGLVRVAVAGVDQVRQRMLVVMVVMRAVGMAFVDVIDMIRALHPGMFAAGSVLMCVC
jgi:hypothetical protein